MGRQTNLTLCLQGSTEFWEILSTVLRNSKNSHTLSHATNKSRKGKELVPDSFTEQALKHRTAAAAVPGSYKTTVYQT